MRAPRAGALLLLVAFLAAATASCIISRGVEVSPLRFGQSDSTTVRSAVKAHLVDGAVALFPEGVSHADAQLKPLKTGAARIVQRTFLGEKTDYLVALGGSTLQVSATDHYRRPPLDVGQPVTVRFHPEGLHVLG